MIKNRIMSRQIPGWDYPSEYDREDEIEDDPYAEDKIRDMRP